MGTPTEPAPGHQEGTPLDFEQGPEMFGRLIDELPAAVFSLDGEGRVVSWSRQAERITGISREGIEGKPLPHIETSRSRGLGKLVEEIIGWRPGRPRNLVQTCRLRQPDGRELYTLASLRILKNAGGTAFGALGILFDLTPHDQLTRRVSVRKPLAKTRSAVQRMIGESGPALEIERRIELAARSDVTVLLTGESGTGKELAASAIHALSKRSERPFLSINCSAIPEPLLESELFGHVRGAFTGAIRDKTGLFQAAEGGTLFLDEVGDLSRLMQVKLLRALQEREVRRVGDERDVRFDARIISATNRNLTDLVSSGAFREDFYYRIRVFEIQLPALRDRAADIPLLVDHYVREFSRDHDKQVRGLIPAALHRLLAYPWPGNIRQLRNAIEHAFVTVEGDRITVDDLPPELRATEAPSALVHESAGGRLRGQSITSEQILEALERSGGKRAEAAKAQGVSRVTLWKKMRQFGLGAGFKQAAEAPPISSQDLERQVPPT